MTGNSRAPRFPATQRVASLAGRVLVRLSAQCLISVANRPAAVYIADNEATIKCRTKAAHLCRPFTQDAARAGASSRRIVGLWGPGALDGERHIALELKRVLVMLASNAGRAATTDDQLSRLGA